MVLRHKRPPELAMGLPRIAYDRLLTKHHPEAIVKELVSTGTSPGAARDAVNLVIETIYRRDRSRARRIAVTGLVIFGAGCVISYLTIFVYQLGGRFVLFYGAILAGLGEFARGWHSRPAPPALLGEDGKLPVEVKKSASWAHEKDAWGR